VAAAAGLTVRTLHYCDQIGLLTPSRRTSAGHRLYDQADVARLYRISLLRRLGIPLDQMTGVLDDPEWQLAPAIDRHLSSTQARAAITARLCTRLAAMAAELARQDNPSPEQLFSTLEEMTMLDNTIHATTSLLVYDDVNAAHDYVVRVFGLVSGHIETGPDGEVGYREVRAGDQVIGLHPAADRIYRSPRAVGAVTGMTVVAVDDADAHYARSVQAGAEIAEELVDRSYGIREYGARDPEGQIWYFQSPLG
jgi:MerR family transcriptional regulator, thiopeptide resistance regulator